MKLRPCSECLRHVRGDEAVCPFCQASLVLAPDAGSDLGARLPRAARAALGAAAVVAIAGCGGSTTKTTDANQTTETTVTVSTSTATTTATAEPTATAMPDDMNMAKPYGAPPVPRMV